MRQRGVLIITKGDVRKTNYPHDLVESDSAKLPAPEHLQWNKRSWENTQARIHSSIGEWNTGAFEVAKDIFRLLYTYVSYILYIFQYIYVFIYVFIDIIISLCPTVTARPYLFWLSGRSTSRDGAPDSAPTTRNGSCTWSFGAFSCRITPAMEMRGGVTYYMNKMRMRDAVGRIEV